MAADGFVMAMIRCAHQELDLRRRSCSPPLRRTPARDSRYVDGPHYQISDYRAEVTSGGTRDHAAVNRILHWFAASARKVRIVESAYRAQADGQDLMMDLCGTS